MIELGHLTNLAMTYIGPARARVRLDITSGETVVRVYRDQDGPSNIIAEARHREVLGAILEAHRILALWWDRTSGAER